ncbi:isopentenyl-diphosphate Delta-isomerase 1-like [Anthonomus grandis grandis]|uniref:isopentenyl-diphosphate Delta-isomerase 1-like n=1 Tax=Anthonomus grandis grandis TaxID=2921223 RepID=UPI00216540F4|nr:isopentenyl-diphosphate Delta-isomerase 1-like [Anthonomus grandis grandis]
MNLLSVNRLLSKFLHTKRMDPTQKGLLQEKCILVDKYDQVSGEATKNDCHLVKPNGEILLHRAFSVFLFNLKGELLVQKRASSKITYPNRYTNTCCSHPLSDILEETEESNALGIKKAAQRRLNYELGIPKEDLPLEKLKYLTRIHYKDKGDGKYGEHEIDYIIFAQNDVRLQANINEVSDLKYIKKEEFSNFIHRNKHQLTPWFHLIVHHSLERWWDSLDNIEKFKDHQNITRLKF